MKNVLIVDDDIDISELISLILKKIYSYVSIYNLFSIYNLVF